LQGNLTVRFPHVEKQVAQAWKVMVDSLAFCSQDPPGFRELAARVLTNHASRLALQATGPVPPWLVLPILSSEAFAGENRAGSSALQAVYHVAAAWELGNLAAACLDAWQDGDTDDALWRELGPGLTVNLSVGLITLSLRTLTRLAKTDLLPLPVVLELKEGFEDTLLRMVEGQHADLGDALTLDDYAAVAAAKSGSLFRLACWSGAVVAGAPAEVADRYGAFGEALGLLIQTWNDLYGLEGALGKRDRGHQRTLPILATLALAGQSEGRGEPPAAGTLEQGGRLYAVMQATLLHQQAAAALARCPMPGRLSLFLDAYAPETLVAGSGRELA
jgi:geranylgeranyl pyrophosphate synthase